MQRAATSSACSRGLLRKRGGSPTRPHRTPFLVAGEKRETWLRGQSGLTNDVRLPEFVPLGDAFQGRAEITHIFWACPILWNSGLMQHLLNYPRLILGGRMRDANVNRTKGRVSA